MGRGSEARAPGAHAVLPESRRGCAARPGAETRRRRHPPSAAAQRGNLGQRDSTLTAVDADEAALGRWSPGGPREAGHPGHWPPSEGWRTGLGAAGVSRRSGGRESKRALAEALSFTGTHSVSTCGWHPPRRELDPGCRVKDAGSRRAQDPLKLGALCQGGPRVTV